MGFLPFLTLILITLKLCGIITMSWFLVWLPLLLPIFFILIIATLGIATGADFVSVKDSSIKRKK